MIWTITSAGTYLSTMQSDLDVLAGTALEYSGTLAGAYTGMAAELAFQVSQGMSAALSTMFVATMPTPVLVARALEEGLEPRPATYSRYILQVEGSGELLTTTEFQGGGPLGRSRWRVVTEATVSNGDDVPVEAVDPGPVTFAGLTSLTLATPVTGVSGAVYDPGEGDPFQIGADAEQPPQLRVRVSAGGSGGSPAGMRAAIREIDWVVAADVRQGTAAGTVKVTVAPAPVGDDQELELGQTIYDTHPAGATMEGTATLPMVDANGTDGTIAYTPGATQAVAVYVEVVGDGTVSEAALTDSITAAVQGVFALLGNGDPVLRLRVIAAVSLPGTYSLTLLTLNGTTTAAVTPATSADILIPSPITVVVT